MRKGNQGLFDQHPFLNRVLVWDKGSKKTRNLLALIGQVRDNRYDHVVNCQRFFSTGLLTALSGAGQRIGYSKNPLSFLFTHRVEHTIGNGKHEIERLNDLISHLADRKASPPALYPADLHYANSQHDRPYMTIAPSSVWFTKQWPAEKWVGLINNLPPQQEVYLIGGPSDRAHCESIAQRSGRGVVLAGALSLLDTAALMKKATMNFVNDSAPLHIASAMKAPVTAFFCSTVPRFGFGPVGQNSRVVQIDGELDCRPCGLHGRSACPKGHFKCAMDIQIQQVLP